MAGSLRIRAHDKENPLFKKFFVNCNEFFRSANLDGCIAEHTISMTHRKQCPTGQHDVDSF